MEKVKQQVFSNFNYAIIESIDKRCVDVKCTYNYKGKTLTHYFSYAKQGNKSNSYYIDRAKADMNKLIKDKKAESVAKKDLKGSEATFFKRHKKPILVATTAVLVAGIATAATLIALKYTGNNPSLVTEEEIDDYLKIPGGTINPIDPYYAEMIKRQALANTTNGNLKSAEIKNLSSYPFYTTSDNEEEHQQGTLPDDANDLTGLYVSNKTMQTKNVYGTYAKLDLMEDKAGMPCFTATAIDENTKIVGGNTFKTRIAFDQTCLAKIQEGNSYHLFSKSHTDFQGLKLAESYSFNNGLSKEETISHFDTKTNSYLRNYANYDSLLRMSNFYSDNNGIVYCISQVVEDYKPIEISEDVVIPTKKRKIDIWRFRNDSKYGWVLDSCAADGRSIYGETESPDATPLDDAIYVEKDEHGELLKKPFAINKKKGIVKFTYGKHDVKDTSAINYVDDETVWSYKKINIKRNSINAASEGNDEIKDITPYYRVDNPDFKDFKFFGSSEFSQDEQFYLVSTDKDSLVDNPTLITYEDIKNVDDTLVTKGDEIPNEEDKHFIKSVKHESLSFDITLDKDGKYSVVIAEVPSGK